MVEPGSEKRREGWAGFRRIKVDRHKESPVESKDRMNAPNWQVNALGRDCLKSNPPSSFRPILTSLAFWPSAEAINPRFVAVGGNTSQSLMQGPMGEEIPSVESICKSVKPYLGVRRSCRLPSSWGSTNSDKARGAENDVSGILGRLRPMSDIGYRSFGSCN